jgi:K+-transporting ATPase KdpF subunit
MPVLYVIGAAVSVALLVYLFFAMLKPESLQ